MDEHEIHNARKWYSKHREHVDRLLNTFDQTAYPPSGADCIRPELWKTAHWRWLSHVVEARRERGTEKLARLRALGKRFLHMLWPWMD